MAQAKTQWMRQDIKLLELRIETGRARIASFQAMTEYKRMERIPDEKEIAAHNAAIVSITAGDEMSNELSARKIELDAAMYLLGKEIEVVNKFKQAPDMFGRLMGHFKRQKIQ